jgi:hypothetical protein
MKKVRLNETDLHRIVKKVIKENDSEYHTDGWANYEKMPVKYFVDSIVDEYFEHINDLYDDDEEKWGREYIETEKENLLSDLRDMIIAYLDGTMLDR